MTKISTRQALENHRNEQRRQAAVLGAPTPRSAAPGLRSTPMAYVYERAGKLVFHPAGDSPKPLTGTLMTEAFAEGWPVLFPDRRTRQAIRNLTDDAEEYPVLQRRLKAILALPSSTRLMVLTDALAQRYWLPSTLDTDSLADWASAFGIKAPTLFMTIQRLQERALEGTYTGNQPIKGLRKAEAGIVESAEYTGMNSDIKMFGHIEEFNVCEREIRNMDHLLLDEYVLDGQAARMRVQETTGSALKCTVSEPFKLKEGKAVVVTDGGEWSLEARIDTIRFTGSSLQVILEGSPRFGGQAARKLSEMGTRAGLFILEKPFHSFGKFITNKRWLSGEIEHEIAERTVPLDILVAGSDAR